jgi:hypothetical protein
MSKKHALLALRSTFSAKIMAVSTRRGHPMGRIRHPFRKPSGTSLRKMKGKEALSPAIH